MRTIQNKLGKLEALKPEKKIIIIWQTSNNTYQICNDKFSFKGDISEHLKKKYPNKRIIIDDI